MASMLGSCARAFVGFILDGNLLVFVIWIRVRSNSVMSTSTRRRTDSAGLLSFSLLEVGRFGHVTESL